jgi:hypothetical protein
MIDEVKVINIPKKFLSEKSSFMNSKKSLPTIQREDTQRSLINEMNTLEFRRKSKHKLTLISTNKYYDKDQQISPLIKDIINEGRRRSKVIIQLPSLLTSSIPKKNVLYEPTQTSSEGDFIHYEETEIFQNSVTKNSKLMTEECKSGKSNNFIHKNKIIRNYLKNNMDPEVVIKSNLLTRNNSNDYSNRQNILLSLPTLTNEVNKNMITTTCERIDTLEKMFLSKNASPIKDKLLRFDPFSYRKNFFINGRDYISAEGGNRLIRRQDNLLAQGDDPTAYNRKLEHAHERILNLKNREVKPFRLPYQKDRYADFRKKETMD